MADGARLSAKLWLPDPLPQGGVPAILEYAPYRKDDATAAGDEQMFGYFAAHGYACVRVDMRGCGDSDGILEGEYLAQEQDDAIEVLAWIAAQPWSDGRVGMIGHLVDRLQRAPGRIPPATAAEGRDQHAARPTTAIATTSTTWAAACSASTCSRGRRRCSATTPARRSPTCVGDAWREIWLRRHRRDAAVRRGVARASTARRLLEARLDLRVLQRDRVPASDGRRLGRRLPQRGPAGPRALRRPVQGPDRAVVAPHPVRRPAGPVDRLPAGVPPLVGSLAQGRADGVHGRAARCAPGCRTRCAPTAAQRRSARAAGSARPNGRPSGREPTAALARSRAAQRRRPAADEVSSITGTLETRRRRWRLARLRRADRRARATSGRRTAAR